METNTHNLPALRADGQAAVRSQGPASGEYLTFRLGAEEYGIDILKVQEIRSYEPPTRIANAPEFIKGVVIGAVADRMLIVMDIEGLMSSADMGLMDAIAA